MPKRKSRDVSQPWIREARGEVSEPTLNDDIKKLVHTAIYSTKNENQMDVPTLEMSEPVFEMIRQELYAQLTELKERGGIIVSETFHGITIKDPEVELKVLTLLPLVFDMKSGIYDVARGRERIGRVYYDGPFQIGPMQGAPNTLHIGALCQFVPE